MESSVPKMPCCVSPPGANCRSLGTSDWNGLVWRLDYLTVMLFLSRGQQVSGEPKLTLSGQILPLIANTTFKFLGMPFKFRVM